MTRSQTPEVDDIIPTSVVEVKRASEPGLRATLGFGATDDLIARPEKMNRPLLIRVDSVNAGQILPVPSAECGIGRHPDNAFCLPDEGLSRFHCRLLKVQNAVFIEDRNSSNGTYVNGERIQRVELNSGNVIQLGPRVSFRFTLATEQEEAALRQLYESSVSDALTGVHNRAYFSTRLEEELAYAVRHIVPLSVILIDIDHFKSVNDTYGHLVGDAVLQRVSQVLAHELRAEDVVARYGGEEFVALLRGIALEGAALAGERLRAAVAGTEVDAGGKSVSVTASFGVASIACCSAASSEALLRRADRRLYRAKESGRNRVVADG